MQTIYKMQAISDQVMSGSYADDVAKKSAHVKVSYEYSDCRCPTGD